jgi:hypothetical protein
MAMALWADGGNPATGDDGIELRVAEGQAWARAGDQDWQMVEEDVTGLFAPGSDPMAYMVAAKEVVHTGTETRRLPLAEKGEIRFERYTFRLDGPTFAVYMREQLESTLRRKGELPPGLNLDTPQIYTEMIGEGEIWIDENGLPLRLDTHIEFPPQGLERMEADLTTDFIFPSSFMLPATEDTSFTNSHVPLSNFTSQFTDPQRLFSVGMFASVISLAFLMIRYWNSK